MWERRREPRTSLDATGRIAVDEHRSLPCIVFDRSPSGVRVALPDAEGVPDRFLLTIDGAGETLVCQAAWRKNDEIGCRTGVPVGGDIDPPRLRRALEPASRGLAPPGTDPGHEMGC